MKGKYKTSSSYCYGCDKNSPMAGTKCSVCSRRAEAVKIKKKNTRQILNDELDTKQLMKLAESSFKNGWE